MVIKKAYFILVLLLAVSAASYAQAPPGFPFQAIMKDNQGAIAKNIDAFVKCQIIKGSSSGTVVYEEVHSVKTNADAVFSILIGQGQKVSGDANSLYAIDWAHDAYFVNIKTAIPSSSSIKWYDPNLSFTDIGSTQLWSVPYALFAQTTVQNGISTSALRSSIPNILSVNGGMDAANSVLGTKDVMLSIAPGKKNSLLQTDSLGNVSWIGISDSKIVSGVLKIIVLGRTTTGDSTIPANSIIKTKIQMAEARVGDPVFVTSMEDVLGFGVYNAFVSADGEVTIRFTNYQDVDAVLIGRKFSILLIK